MQPKIRETLAVARALVDNLEFVADDMVATAHRMGDQPIADALRVLARHNRVEAMQLKAKLAAVQVEYDKLYRRDRAP